MVDRDEVASAAWRTCSAQQHSGDRCVPLSVIEDTSGLKRHIIH